jgi:hypothetical protein
MTTRSKLIIGMARGSFLLDPQSGRRRRALLRDRSVRWSSAADQELGRTPTSRNCKGRRTVSAGPRGEAPRWSEARPRRDW